MKNYIKYKSQNNSVIGEVLLSVIMLILLATTTYYNFYIYQDNVDKELRKTRLKIENRVSDILHFARSLFLHFGEEIKETQENNYSKIASILSDPTYNSSPLRVWIGNSWVDKLNYLRINTLIGKDPIKMKLSLREGFDNLQENPGVFYFSTPIIGPQSGRLVIPMAMGVEKGGNYIGYILAGLSITELSENLETIAEKFSFAIFDNNNKNIFKSSDIDANLNTLYLKNSIDREGKEKFVVQHKDFIFKERIVLPEMNLTILIGYNKALSQKKFLIATLPKVAEILAMWLFFMILLFSYKRRLIRSNVKDIIEQDKIINNIIDRIRIPLIGIHQKCSILSSGLEKGKPEPKLIKKELDEIAGKIKHILVPVLGEMSYEKVEISKIVNDCIFPFRAIAKEKKIIFKVKIKFKKLEMDIDVEVFRQILSGLLALSFEQSLKKGVLCMEMQEITVHNNQYLEIRITNNNFGLDDKQMSQILERVGVKDIKKHGMSMDYNYIKTLVEKHNGNMVTENNDFKEKNATVRLPIFSIDNNPQKIRKLIRNN